MSSILVWKTGSTASTDTPVPLWGIANTSTTCSGEGRRQEAVLGWLGGCLGGVAARAMDGRLFTSSLVLARGRVV